MKIIVNAICTPDGTVLLSATRHDFRTHVDANGKTYGVDGGTDYLKRIGDIGDCEEMSIYEDDQGVFRRTPNLSPHTPPNSPETHRSAPEGSGASR